MPLNVPGILVPLHLLINPRLVVPSIVVKGLSFSLIVVYLRIVVHLVDAREPKGVGRAGRNETLTPRARKISASLTSRRCIGQDSAARYLTRTIAWSETILIACDALLLTAEYRP